MKSLNDLFDMTHATGDIDHGIDPRYPGDDPVSPTNMDRAQRVLTGLLHYDAANEDAAATTMSDFLSDLMHLARMNGLDFDTILERARRHHEHESQAVD